MSAADEWRARLARRPHVVCTVCGDRMPIEATGWRGDPTENAKRKLGRKCRRAGHRAEIELSLPAGDADGAEGAGEGLD